MGARRPGTLAPGPVRAASGLAGRAGPAVPAGLGPVQPGAVRPDPARGAGAACSGPARSEPTRIGTGHPLAPPLARPPLDRVEALPARGHAGASPTAEGSA
jgi:hypothetical protein